LQKQKLYEVDLVYLQKLILNKILHIPTRVLFLLIVHIPTQNITGSCSVGSWEEHSLS
jgi:hypothetical protein